MVISLPTDFTTKPPMLLDRKLGVLSQYIVTNLNVKNSLEIKTTTCTVTLDKSA